MGAYMKNPEISVIMGIYNCADTLSEAIESVLGQTMSEWELIMCDDGSSDATSEVAEFYIKKYPERMVLLKNKENRGLNYTLNRCLKMATGKYIARMDGDDICLPERFAVEYEILEKEKAISIVSTDMGYFDETGIWGNISHPEYPKKEDFLHGSPFCHAPCMVRKEAYDAVKGYTEKKRLLRVEDYHLWIKMYEVGYRGKNIPKQLYLMRDDKAAYKRRKFRYRVNEAYVRGMAVRKLGLPISGYLYAIQPIIIGILPKVVYDYFHKRKLESNSKKNNVCKNIGFGKPSVNDTNALTSGVGCAAIFAGMGTSLPNTIVKNNVVQNCVETGIEGPYELVYHNTVKNTGENSVVRYTGSTEAIYIKLTTEFEQKYIGNTIETRGLRCFSSYSNRDDEYKGIYILNNSVNLENTDASITCNYTRSDIEINCKKIKKIVIENNTGMMKDKKSVNIYTDKGYVMDYFSIHNPCMIGSVPEKARYCFNINNN